ncbi:hypothetical protein [Arthrobacter sp. NPDC056727]|uniref:hypothetical protein n=1 Tax=Arthrobacter sp. NPDC056727 TaxID=3345927 RepID=UPI003671C6DC
MKRTIIGAAVLVTGAAAALTAASIPSASVTASAEPVPGIVRQAEAYAQADATAEKGMREAIRVCMAGAGFKYTPPATIQTLDLSGAIGFPRLTVEAAKANGYEGAGDRGPQEPAQGTSEGQLFSDPAFMAALNGKGSPTTASTVQGTGTVAGGCRGEAMTKIYGSADNYMLATGIAYNSFFPATLSASGDSGLTKAVQDWQGCMKETAYPSFSNPQQASDAGKSAGGQEEMRIAVTDAVCREKIGFHAAIDKVLDRYVTTRMRELAPQIEQVKQIRETAAANASAFTETAAQ